MRFCLALLPLSVKALAEAAVALARLKVEKQQEFYKECFIVLIVRCDFIQCTNPQVLLSVHPVTGKTL